MTTSTAPDTCMLPKAVPGGVPQAPVTPSWPVVGLLLDALTRRDFASMRACFDDAIRFRALVPPGLLELDHPTDVAAKFEAWFGGPDQFEILDASIGQIGSRLYARWKVRLTPADGPARVCEQHVYTRGEGRITDLDLLCSGFHAENGASA